RSAHPRKPFGRVGSSSPTPSVKESPSATYRWKTGLLMHRIVSPGAAQCVGRLLVRGQEGLDAELREGHVDGRPERRDRADEGEFARIRTKPQRDRYLALRRTRLETAGVRDELRVQVAQLIRSGHRDLATQPLQDVATPLREVHDPRRQPVRV